MTNLTFPLDEQDVVENSTNVQITTFALEAAEGNNFLPGGTVTALKTPQEILKEIRAKNSLGNKTPSAANTEIDIDSSKNALINLNEPELAVATSEAIDTGLPQTPKHSAKMAEALVKADKLRVSADASYKQYVVAGRDAVIVLMGDVYALYCEIKKDAMECKKIIKHMSAAVATNSQVRVNSTDASVLVRYVCREMSDKKVSIYSRCIALAHENEIAIDGLPALVKATPNGWLGVLDKYATAKPVSITGTAVEQAKQQVRQEKTITTIPAKDWDNDETVRVYIATHNDDATADVKYAHLSKEATDLVLKRYLADKKKLEKQVKEAAKAAKSAVTLSSNGILMFELDIHNAEIDIYDLRVDIDGLLKAGKMAEAEILKDSLQVKELKLSGYKKDLEAAKALIKAADEA